MRDAAPRSHATTGPALSAGMLGFTLTTREFEQFREWLLSVSGIHLSEAKRALLIGRLAQRLRHHELPTFGDYFRLLTSGNHPQEHQLALDLLTTNETHFFREPRHFEFLAETVVARHPAGRLLRVWSAASSSGEEPYSIAMTLASRMGTAPWEVLGSDVSQRVLEKAMTGEYSMTRASRIPTTMLRTYCLRGVGPAEGRMRISPEIRARVSLRQLNLNQSLPDLGSFEVVFLRNVMIYFELEKKREVVGRVLRHVKRGGYLVIGHSESLHGISSEIESMSPSIYRRL